MPKYALRYLFGSSSRRQHPPQPSFDNGVDSGGVSGDDEGGGAGLQMDALAVDDDSESVGRKEYGPSSGRGTHQLFIYVSAESNGTDDEDGEEHSARPRLMVYFLLNLMVLVT